MERLQLEHWSGKGRRERAIAKAYYAEKNLQLQIRYTVVSGN